MLNAIRTTFFLWILLPQSMYAQNSPACPFPPPPGAEDCFSTCVYCDLDGYTGINNGTPSTGQTICGAIVIHNDQWFGFNAGSSSITFNLFASNCQNGDGLQIALFGDCNDFDAIACNPGAPGSANTDLSLSYDDFIVGQTYYLMIDGWTADVCDFEITVVDGTVAPAPLGIVTSPQGPSLVCSGAVAVYEVDEVAGAGFYQWTAPAGASINGLGNAITVDAAYGNSVTITFGTAGGSVCVTAGNVCTSGASTACLPVTNLNVPPTILAPLTICNEDLPYVWSEEPFLTLTNPGVYNLSSSLYQSYLGCDSVVKQIIVVKAPILTNLGTKFLCQGECFPFGDTTYCQTGTYFATMDSYLGCDSNVVVHLEVIGSSSAAISAPDGQTITCLKPSLSLSSQTAPGLAHLWKNQAGDTLGTSNSITVNSAGYYFHFIEASAGGTMCGAQSKILIKENTYAPPVTAMGGTIDSTHPTVQLMGNSIISGVTYHWTGPNGFTSNLKKPLVSEPGFYTLTVTNPGTGCSSSITVEVTFLT